MKHLKRLIVNGDDFGLAESINRGIIVAHRDGILTSTSLLANGQAFDQAVALSRAFPQLTVGVHLNITQGRPVSPAARIPTLLNPRGELHLSPFPLWTRLLMRQISLDDIHREFRAQILKVLDAGVTPTHLDGHLHVHILPPLAPVVIALAHEFGLRIVRCPTENLEGALPVLWKIAGAGIPVFKRSVIAYTVSALARRLRKQLRTAGLLCSDAFYGLAHTGSLDAKTLSALLDLVSNGTSELMCHPGYASAELESSGGQLTREREEEVLALTAPEIKEAVARLGIDLTNFRHLQETASV
jgi:hopanoid biosynthesis associated protein HpnK